MRRVNKAGILGVSLCVVSFLLVATGLTLWIWVEGAPSPAERSARMRCCALCHGNEWTKQLLPALERHKSGNAIRPILRAAIIGAHPSLSKGAEDELTEWMHSCQLPLLADSRRDEAAATLYRAKCAACHGADGNGSPGLYPPLRASEWLTEAPSRLPEVLMNGLQGPITVRGQEWNSIMLPPGISNEEEMNTIILYIRKHFSR